VKVCRIRAMSYQVLARKLRPAGFGALVGQEHVVRALTHALDHDRVHHAYLFTGTRGVGKTTIARILAKCLNCETKGVSSSPCLVCPTCIDVSEGRFLDLIEVDAASRTGVNDTRELLENAQYMPVRGRYKVYLIDEVHMLSNAAFNALLKTLEEPPPHVKFLLATTEVKKVPVTVLSRCLQFQLKNLSAERIANYLESILVDEHVDAERAALDLIARAARGSMRDALSITDQAIAFGQGKLTQADIGEMLGVVGRDETGGLIEAIASGSAERVLAVTAEFAERAVDFASVLADLASALHAMAVEAALGRNEQQAPINADAVHLYYQIAIMGQRDLSLAPDPRSGAEMTLLRMLAFAPEPDSRVPKAEPSQTTLMPAAETGPTNPASMPGREEIKGIAPPPLSTTELLAPPSTEAQTQVVSPQKPWHELVEDSEASGVTRMLMEHSVLAQRQGGNWLLHLDPRHDTLLVEAQRLAIARALKPFGAMEISVLVQSSLEETPAVRKARLQAEAQGNAEAAVAGDPVVQSILKEFGGRIQRVVPVSEKARSRT
jgi:DNA polymerase III subunit gamma/tau